MYFIGLILVLILVLIWRLTGSSLPWKGERAFDSRQTVAEVLHVAGPDAGSGGLTVYGAERTREARDVLLEMMSRLDVDRAVALEELRHLGFPTDGLPPWPQKEARPHLSVFRNPNQSYFQDMVEQALLVGIHIARTDDDYAGVGDGHLDPETLARQAAEAEQLLFGDGRRERYSLYGKAALVLQDMLQDRPDEPHRQHILKLLKAFDDRLEALREEMETAMAKVPEPESLQWGDGQTRRLYYFKMGVTNALRRAGHLKSLGHLYRHQGVNYNVEEAYRLAAAECPPLILAGEIGIDRLIEMGPAEVQGLVQKTLPDRNG